MEGIKRQNIVLIFIALILLLIINNWLLPLWNDDEAAYAGMAMNMIETGNWINPQFDYSDIHRKTPLHMWFIATSNLIFGYNEWAVRFSSLLGIFLCSVLIYRWVSSQVSQEVGIYSAFIFATNLLVVALAKIAFTDATLILFSTLAAISYFQIMTKKGSNHSLYLFWTSVSLGILIKGPAILIFLFFLVLGICIRDQSIQPIRKLRPLVFILPALLPFTIWAYFSYQMDNGEFLSWLLDWYILKRTSGSVLGQTGPPGYHLAIMGISAIPYFMAFILALRLLFVRKSWQHPFVSFTLVWLLSGWLFYEIMPSKLPSYAATSYPAMAILMAYGFYEFAQSCWNKMWFKLVSVLQLLLAVGLSTFGLLSIQNHFGAGGIIFTSLFGLTLIVGAILGILYLERSKATLALRSMCVTTFFALFVLWGPLASKVVPYLEGPRLIGNKVGFEMKSNEEVLLAVREHHIISLPYYLKRESRVQLSDNIDYYLDDIRNLRFRAIVCREDQVSKIDPTIKFDRTSFNVIDLSAGKLKKLEVLILE